VAAGAAIAPGASVAWVDFLLHLYLGDVVTGTQHVLARIKAFPDERLARAGRRIYWVDHSGTYIPALHHRGPVIRDLDLATGRIRVDGPGESVFPAADGRHVFIAVTDTSLLEVPVTGSGTPHPRRLPPGWFMPLGEGIAIGDGILVQSVYPLSGGPGPNSFTFWAHHPHTFGVWDLRSGRVRPIVKGYDLIDAIGPAGAPGGMLAWLPVSCSLGQNCRMRITSTQTLSTRAVRSPLGQGFGGGAFSPDGRWLAVFVNQIPPLVPRPQDLGRPRHLVKAPHVYVSVEPFMSQLALIDTRTGILHLVPRSTMQAISIGGWARWLPDGRHLIVGGDRASYLVDSSAMTARPLFFLPGRNHGHDRFIQDTGDLNFSAVVVPPRR
jgi:hypothetical protein